MKFLRNRRVVEGRLMVDVRLKLQVIIQVRIAVELNKELCSANCGGNGPRKGEREQTQSQNHETISTSSQHRRGNRTASRRD